MPYLWKATIIDISKPCAKFTSLGQVHKPKFLWILWVPWCNNVCWTKIELIGYFPIPLLHQFHLYVKCGWIACQYLLPLKPMTLILSFKSYDITCKKSCRSFGALLSFMLSFQSQKVNTTLVMILHLHVIYWQGEDSSNYKWLQ